MFVYGRRFRFLVSLILAGLACGVHGAQEVQLQAVKDNTLIEREEGDRSNGAGDSFFVGRNAEGEIRRGLIAFDFVEVPQAAVILDVRLTLHVTRTNAGAEPVGLHRVLADWGEGTSNGSGSGAEAAENDATWIHRFYGTDLSWENPGGDFAPSPSATADVADVGLYTWESTPGLVEDVQRWVLQPETNFGWLLRGNEDASVTTKRFASRENVSEGSRPVLTVIYAGEAPPILFRRGDSNADGAVDIADAICALGYLFGAVDDVCKQKISLCRDSADANDDGTVDIADAVTVLVHLFGAGGPLPDPFAFCGEDPTADGLDCTVYEAPCE